MALGPSTWTSSAPAGLAIVVVAVVIVVGVASRGSVAGGTVGGSVGATVMLKTGAVGGWVDFAELFGAPTEEWDTKLSTLKWLSLNSF